MSLSFYFLLDRIRAAFAARFLLKSCVSRFFWAGAVSRCRFRGPGFAFDGPPAPSRCKILARAFSLVLVACLLGNIAASYSRCSCAPVSFLRSCLPSEHPPALASFLLSWTSCNTLSSVIPCTNDPPQSATPVRHDPSPPRRPRGKAPGRDRRGAPLRQLCGGEEREFR
ncbi:hypothetical protein B0H16DRAFT_53444 [Mycena metata]|uniref:Uncharacterized protein n=1 Tax=Mycena metata TaxID=1033252 RepID=A0AAD7N0Z3_9AGAR|nr:hypothetical protein B0H16DRAFT_53444 [Mycena metata]